MTLVRKPSAISAPKLSLEQDKSKQDKISKIIVVCVQLFHYSSVRTSGPTLQYSRATALLPVHQMRHCCSLLLQGVEVGDVIRLGRLLAHGLVLVTLLVSIHTLYTSRASFCACLLSCRVLRLAMLSAWAVCWPMVPMHCLFPFF